jgi:glutathione S-transferase
MKYEYTLIGSYPSPFVRRVRMVMENIPYNFRPINIYEASGGDELKRVNPANQIPVLLSGEQKIWDSRVIFNYLNMIHRLENLDWEDENNLTAISGAMDAGVSLLMMKRSGIDINQNLMIVNRYKQRIDTILEHFSSYAEYQGLEEWRFLTMSIYSFLDWGRFREIIDLKNYPQYQRFLNGHSSREIVQATQIPKDA